MNTTTNTKLTLPMIESLERKVQRTLKKAIQRERNHRAHSSVNRWPAEHKNTCTGAALSTATYNQSFNSDSNMKTLNLRKLALVTLGFVAVLLIGKTVIDAEGLNVAGEVIGYVAGLGILGLAALDNTRTKRSI